MKKNIKIFLICIIILIGTLFAGCAPGTVGVGVGVYVPGAWVGPYGGYPPVRVGYPIY